MVHPMTSEDLWPKCHRPPLMPPLYHKQLGRLRKKMIRSAGEQPSKSNPTATKLQRQGGHNRRSCPKAKEGRSSQKGEEICPRYDINQKGYKTIKSQATCEKKVGNWSMFSNSPWF
ncbi:unnamed protein product [Prunus armeniaca]